MENKPILVFYIGLKDYSNVECSHMINLIRENMDPISYSNNVTHYYIPAIEERDTRVECVNPIVIDGEEYKKIQQQLEETQEKLKNLIIENE